MQAFTRKITFLVDDKPVMSIANGGRSDEAISREALRLYNQLKQVINPDQTIEQVKQRGYRLSQPNF